MKEVDQLIRAVRKNGFEVLPNGSGHYKVAKDGVQVVDNEGPVTIAATPSDKRWKANIMKRLIRAEVITSDPWRQGRTHKPGKGKPFSAAARAAHAETTRRLVAEREGETQKIRDRINPIVTKLGGWGKDGLKSQLAHTMHWFLSSRNRVNNWPTPSAAVVSMSYFSKGNSATPKVIERFDFFLRELEKEDDPVARYFELVRESKGIGVQRPQEAAVELPLQRGGPTLVKDISEAVKALEPELGQFETMLGRVQEDIASEALFYMAYGSQLHEKEEILAVAAKIRSLETIRKVAWTSEELVRDERH